MAVGGVFAETDVGDDEELGEAFAEEACRGDDGTFWVVGCGAEGILGMGMERYAEKDNGFQTFGDEGFKERDEFIEAAAVLAGEGWDDGVLVGVIGNEERVNEHGLVEFSEAGVASNHV